MDKILQALFGFVIIAAFFIASAFVLSNFYVNAFYLAIIGVICLFFSPTLFFIYQLKKTAQDNRHGYEEYAKTIIGGLVGGLIVAVLTELKPANPFSIEGIFASVVVLLLIFFIASAFAPIFISFYKKPRRKKSRGSSH